MANANTIMVIDILVEESKQNEFNTFYQDVYIPEYLRNTSEVLSARRYAQTEGFIDGNKSNGHFLTVYELASEQAAGAVAGGIDGATKEASEQMKAWKQNGITYYDCGFYNLMCRHGRPPKTEPWQDSFIYTLRWLEKKESSTPSGQFQWVDYFNREMFRVKEWLTCRTYMRMDCQPPGYMTVFEAPSEEAVLAALDSIDEDYDEDEQKAFIDFLQNGVGWHDSLMLKPIYFRSNTDRSAVESKA